MIRVIDDGVLQDTPFLDISDQVQIESETGLLGLAFAPDYAESGLFYVFFNRHEGNGNLYLEEFHRSVTDPDQADPYSGRVVLRIVKPWENHNAGMLQFGTDGYLYASVGDGDSGVLDPPGAFAQTLDDLLGNILRIDPRETADGEPYSVPESNPFVGVDGTRPEIWAYGFRNPWRFSIDPKTGDLLVGDVGEGTREEIDLIPAGKGGLNFGWPCFEGTVPFDPTATCPGAVAPILDYNHDTDLCSVIGGVTLHDPRLPSLDGAFLYGDLCGGEVRALRVTNGAVSSDDDLKLNVSGLDSFGLDALGRAYAVVTCSSGRPVARRRATWRPGVRLRSTARSERRGRQPRRGRPVPARSSRRAAPADAAATGCVVLRARRAGSGSGAASSNGPITARRSASSRDQVPADARARPRP